MKKKIIAFIFVALIATSAFTACSTNTTVTGSNPPKDSSAADIFKTEEPTPSPTAEPTAEPTTEPTAEPESSEEETYLAQGTIPASAKLYPIVDENVPLDVAYDYEIDKTTVTDEDIREIITQVDQLSQLDMNDGSPDWDTSELNFLKYNTTEEEIERVKEVNEPGILIGVQPSTISVLGGSKIEACVYYKVHSVDDGVDYIGLAAEGYELSDGIWKFIGRKSLFHGDAKRYTIAKDPVTYKMVITDLEEDNN